MGYSSDSPYDPTPRLKRDRSIAGSSFSVTSGGSFDSTSNLKQYDAVKDEYNGVLKSGRRHLSEMASARSPFIADARSFTSPPIQLHGPTLAPNLMTISTTPTIAAHAHLASSMPFLPSEV